MKTIHFNNPVFYVPTLAHKLEEKKIHADVQTLTICATILAEQMGMPKAQILVMASEIARDAYINSAVQSVFHKYVCEFYSMMN